MLKLGTSSDKLISASAGSHCTAVLLLFMICLFAFSCAINDDDDDDESDNSTKMHQNEYRFSKFLESVNSTKMHQNAPK